MTLTPTIGLEVHCELKTATKMFCNSRNDPDENRPNVNVCPVCMAHPGTLPVINREAVRKVLQVGVALGGNLADYTEFDRKNYFYPDLPKGYQLSQYDYPLVSGGSLRDVAITRVHLEEDTASSVHDDVHEETLIDYNRAGVPLMELVTEPVMHSAKDAGDFARELQLLLRYLGTSDADMEKGLMRLEANVSVSATNELGTKVEVKNINSFRALERAIEFEIKRQSTLIESGAFVTQETRGWDESKQATFSQRTKEGSADYRYFPDPDLQPLRISLDSMFTMAELEKTLPELPNAKRARYVQIGIKKSDAEVLVAQPSYASLFDQTNELLGHDKAAAVLAANYIVNDIAAIASDLGERDTYCKDISFIKPIQLAELIGLIKEKKISSRGAKDILPILQRDGGNPAVIAEKAGLLMNSDKNSIDSLATEVLSDNPTVVLEFRSGKDAALTFLIGAGMKKSKGAADPQLLRSALIKLSESGK